MTIPVLQLRSNVARVKLGSSVLFRRRFGFAAPRLPLYSATTCEPVPHDPDAIAHPSEHKQNVDPQLAEIAMRALKFRPEERYASADEVTDLHRFDGRHQQDREKEGQAENR